VFRRPEGVGIEGGRIFVPFDTSNTIKKGTLYRTLSSIYVKKAISRFLIELPYFYTHKTL